MNTPLTPREKEVVKFLGLGYENRIYLPIITKGGK
jgi:hypothetical protein